MSKTRKQKVTNLDSLLPDTCKSRREFTVNFEAKSKAQQRVVELWPKSRIIFLLGPAGTGKSHVSLALAIKDALQAKDGKIMLTRPMITVGENIGYLPGNVEEKVMPWLLPFHDVLGQMSFSRWEEFTKVVEVETVPLGMMRGRTIRNGTLICDEFQNASYEQIKCVLTRIGAGAKIIISGDPYQSDCYDVEDSPMMEIARKLYKLDTVSVVQFDGVKDQLRDPLISDILARI